MTERVLVAGVGNIFLRDDGFGSEVARRLLAEDTPDGVQVTDYGIRARHLAYDVTQGWDRLILIDLLPGRGNPGSVHVVQVDPALTPTTPVDPHGMTPSTVLAAVGHLGAALPPTVLVGCEPADVGEGLGLTAAVTAAIRPAVTAVLALLGDRHVDLAAGGR